MFDLNFTASGTQKTFTQNLKDLGFQSFTRLEIDFSSRGAILLPGVSICIALFGIEEQFL
jgi:hypothetical protein